MIMYTGNTKLLVYILVKVGVALEVDRSYSFISKLLSDFSVFFLF